jgi:hypothetical protein
MIIWRHKWDILSAKFGLPYTRNYMANMDYMGVGPEGKLGKVLTKVEMPNM